MDEDTSRPATEATDGLSAEETTGPTAEYVSTPAADTPPVGTPTRPRTQARHVVLGFIAVLFGGFFLAPLLSALFAWLMQSTGENPAFAAVTIIAGILQLLLPALALGLSIAAFVVGKNKGDARLLGLGKGGLAAFATAVLVALLAFGTCMVILGTSGL